MMMGLAVPRVLWSCPWASAAEIAAMSGRSVARVNRGLEELEKQGIAARLEAGRRVRPCPRWMLTALGIAECNTGYMDHPPFTP